MTRSQMVLWSLLAVLLAFAPADSVWAVSGTQVPDPGVLLQANPTASGMKLYGKLSIFYTFSATPISCPGGPDNRTVDMHIAIHAWQGTMKNFHTAGQLVQQKCYLSFTPQRLAVTELINTVLMPKFGFSTFELKDADNLVQDENGDGGRSNPFFMMMDFTLAAQ